MKKTELIFNLISIPMDAVCLLLAGIIAFHLRENREVIAKPIIYHLALSDFLTTAYKIIPVLLLIFALLGLYNLRGTRKFFSEFSRVTIGTSLGLLIVILLFFFNQTIFPSRFIILATWALGIVFVMLGRSALKYLQVLLFLKNIGLHKLVIIGGDQNDAAVIEQVYRNKRYGYKISSEINSSGGMFEQLQELFDAGQIDEILQTNPALDDQVNLQLVQFARNKGLQFSFVPNLFEVQRNAVEMHSLKGVPVISLKNTPLDGWGKVIKRLSDIVISSVCLVVTSPIFLVLAVWVKIDSRGKVIYSAWRGGRGRDFKCYKFRSMYSHLSVGDDYGGERAEKIRQQLWKKNDRGGEQSPFLKIRHDPRVTRAGRFLRKTKLDELPQFWNVLKGDMSMVGPRAHVLDEVKRYRDRYRRMFSIKPGVFGMSQIAQISAPTLPFEEEIKVNTYYIENWSPWLDLKILAKSFYLLFWGTDTKEDY